MNVDRSIFKAYDIRGIYPDQLDGSLAYALGRAFITFLKCDAVVVGRDMRLGSPDLKENLVRGLCEQGAEVIDIGMVATDQFYYACATMNQPGVMVTASHNPPEYCGFKMVRNMPYLLSGDDGIQDLYRIVTDQSFDPLPGTRGKIAGVQVTQGFVDTVLGLINPEQIEPLKIVADTANGMTGPILQAVYEHLPVDLIGLYLEPDGRAPNHGLDPMQPENRAELESRVKQEGASAGFAFDGDGDRFFVVDDRGLFVPGDFVAALLAAYMLERHPGASIIYDVRCSWAVRDCVQARGGKALVERVGHSYLKPRLFEEQAVFAGELSGHYYFTEFFGADSGIVPSLLMLEMLSLKGQTLSELLAPLESRYHLSGEINSRVEDTQAKIEELAARYSDGRVEWIDGISISYDDWHFNVRPSNTEPLLRLNLEALNRDTMEARRDEVLGIIRA